MTKLVGSKRNFIITILILCMSFTLTMIWSVYTYIKITNDDYEMYQSRMIADQYRILYEQERKSMLTLEPILEATMKEILVDLGEKIVRQQKIDSDYLGQMHGGECVPSRYWPDTSPQKTLSGRDGPPDQ